MQIKINKGTIVGQIIGTKVHSVTLEGDVYVEAARAEDGCWVYGIGDDTYLCAGGMATWSGHPDCL